MKGILKSLTSSAIIFLTGWTLSRVMPADWLDVIEGVADIAKVCIIFG